MKITPSLLVSLVLTAAACAPSVETAGSGGSRGGAGGALDVADAGVDAAPSCAELVADLAAKIALARACTDVGTWTSCDISAQVPDECGCSAPLDHFAEQAVQDAHGAAAALVAAGCAQTCAPGTCAQRYNDPSYHGGCVAAAEGGGLCMFAGAD